MRGGRKLTAAEEKAHADYLRAEEERNLAMRAAMAAVAAPDLAKKERIEKMFSDQDGLYEAIKEQILPALFSIKTRKRIGMGFFQHPTWIGSNAHVIPTREDLDGLEAYNVDGEPIIFDIKQSFPRPSESSSSPDLIIIEANSNSKGSPHIPVEFNETEGSEEVYTFYLNFNAEHSSSGSDSDSSGVELKFLEELPWGGLPLIYVCEDGSAPMPGTSGTPIIQARVIDLKPTPCWQFRVVSVLYGRCSAAWYNEQVIDKLKVKDELSLVCAIPANEDFSRILEMLIEEDESDRSKGLATGAKALGDKEASEKHMLMHELKKVEFDSHLKAYEEGATSLDIALPEGLEKLWYDRIIKVKESLLIEEVRKKELGRDKKFPHVPPVTCEDLLHDFNNFIEGIRKSEDLVLKIGNEVLLSPEEFFRIDVSGGGDSDWMLQIQDNTGKYKSGSTPLSSVFSIVKISKACTEVAGKELAKLLQESYDLSEEKTLALAPKSASAATKMGTFARSKAAGGGAGGGAAAAAAASGGGSSGGGSSVPEKMKPKTKSTMKPSRR